MIERQNSIYDVISLVHDTKQNIENNKDSILPYEPVIAVDTNEVLYKDEQGNLVLFNNEQIKIFESILNKHEIELTDLIPKVNKNTIDINTARNEIISENRIATNSISSNKLRIASDDDKIKLINLSEEVKNAIIGTAPVAPDVADNSITTEKIADGSVTLRKTDIFRHKRTSNLFNKRELVLGHIVEGKVVTGSAYDNYTTTKDYIEVEPNSKYYSSLLRNISFFDENKTYINQVVNVVAGIVTEFDTGNAKYARLSVRHENVDSLMFVKDDYPTVYLPYETLELDELRLNNLNIIDKSISEEKIDFIESTVNLADQRDKVDGVISGTQIVPSDLYYTTKALPVEYGKTYSISYARKIQRLNANQTVISEVIPDSPYEDIKFTPAIQVKYIRISYKRDLIDSFMMNEGDVLKDYIPFGKVIEGLLIHEDDIIKNKVEDLGKGDINVNISGSTINISDSSGIKVNGLLASRDNKLFNFSSTYLNNVKIHSNGDDIAPLRTWTTVGANHGYTSISVVTTPHDKTTDDLGSVWSSGGKEYTLLKVETNKLTFGHDYIITDGVVSGDSTRASGDIIHVRNATNTNTVNGTIAGGQLYPSVNNQKYKILLDDVEFTGTNKNCSNLKIVESYRIMDYKAIIDWARANVGKSFGTSNSISPCISVNLTYEFTSARTCIVSTGYYFHTKINLGECGTIQSSAMSSTGATLKRYLPHVGVKDGYDFSELVDMTDYNTNSYFYKDDLLDPNLPPSRSIDWLYNGNNKLIGFSFGYIPDKSYTKNSIRKDLTSKIWDLRSTKKNYPVATGGITVNNGDYMNFIAYRNYLLPDVLTNNTQVDIGGNKYIFVDSHSSRTGIIDVYGCNGKDIQVLFSDKFTLKSDCVVNDSIYYSIQNKGYAVLKI